jgi:ParB-like chromosome segregation protein Spo0J
MAVVWTKGIEVTRGTVYSFDPVDIKVIATLNGRHELPDIEWLIEDMLKPAGEGGIKGQIQPIIVRSDGGAPTLIAGHSRWRAVFEINKRKLTPFPLRINAVYEKCNEEEGFILGISENRFRNATTELDDAHNIRILEKFGKTEEEIARIYFPHAKDDKALKSAIHWVKQRQSLLQLAPEAKKAVKEGRIKTTAAVAISKLSAEAQKAIVARPGSIKGSDLKPYSVPKPAKESKQTSFDPQFLSLQTALEALFAECDQQKDVMVYEVHRDTLRAVREAFGK